MIRVPQPPKLDLAPQSEIAVVTVAAGEEGRSLFAASGPAMRRFAERIGADLVVLDWPGHESWPMSAKYGIGRALDAYSRILYADADVLFRDGCVNPLDLCPPDRIGLFDELPFIRRQPQFGQEEHFRQFLTRHGFAQRRMGEIPWYCNAGIAVVPQEAQHLFLPPDFDLSPHHLSEQHLLNARLLDGAFPVCLLDRRCNWQNWTDWGWRTAPKDAVLHFSGGGEIRKRRVGDIRRIAAGEDAAAVAASPASEGISMTRAEKLRQQAKGTAAIRASFSAREVRATRLTICESCPDLLPGRRCGKCGCSIETRASRKDGTCPAGRWPLEVIQ